MVQKRSKSTRPKTKAITKTTRTKSKKVAKAASGQKAALDLVYDLQKELSLHEQLLALLHWDQQTIMPKAAIKERADQVAYLSRRAHKLLTSQALSSAVRRLRSEKIQASLSATQRIMLQKLDKKIRKAQRLPPSFVEELSRLTVVSHQAWEEARSVKDFSRFAPVLKKMIAMKKKEAKLIDPNKHPYDVLLDDYEEGMTTEEIDRIFAQLKGGLLHLIKQIRQSKTYRKQKDQLSRLDVPVASQRAICDDIRQRMLLDADRTYHALSVHPFMTRISANDIRTTTAYRKGKPLFSFGSTVHESGHALYELGFDHKYKDTILFDAASYAMHESQSRFWELFIMQLKPFWKGYYPVFRKRCPSLGRMTWRGFYAQVNQVRPSLIRIEGDEVTYGMHIIIRYEIERSLIEGSLSVDALPGAWNQKYKEYLGVVPRHAAEGVLQDVHWSEGYFGYFPTYALGTIYAALFFEELQRKHPDIMRDLERLSFGRVLAFLRRNVHRHAATMQSKEIIRRSCKKEITPEPLLRYLRKKYESLYP